MSKIKITIDTDNAAFEDYNEVPRILNELARKIVEKSLYGLTEFDITGKIVEKSPYKLDILDINGNIVGKMEVE